MRGMGNLAWGVCGGIFLLGALRRTLQECHPGTADGTSPGERSSVSGLRCSTL